MMIYPIYANHLRKTCLVSHSFITKIYIASLSTILRSAPDPCTAKDNSFIRLE